MSSSRTCVVPDLDDEILKSLERVNEVLLGLAAVEEELVEPLPEPLADGRALAAVERIWTALRPTQGRSGRVQLLGPDGHYEHTPLAFVRLSTADLAIFGAMAAVLGEHVAQRDELICELLTDVAHETEDNPAEVVSEITRLHGLLDLAWTDDVQLLYDRINGTTGNVMLTPEEEAAYQRTVDRLNAMWTLGSALDRFRY
jgi:hypothetical protein